MRWVWHWTRFLAAALLAILWPLAAAAQVEIQEPEVVAHIFWQRGCPHCTRAKEALGEIRHRVTGMQIDEIELGVAPDDDRLFRTLLGLLDVRDPAVPFVVVGPHWTIGFAAGGQSAAAYERMIERCRVEGCVDVVAGTRRLAEIAAGRVQTGGGAAPSGRRSCRGA